MDIKRLVLGDFQTNCYVLTQRQSSQAVVIDTGLRQDQPLEYLLANDLSCAGIILTHGHADHIAGLAALKQHFSDARIYIHKADADALTNAEYNLSSMTGIELTCPAADVKVSDNDIIDLAGIELRVIHTPGHTPGGISLYCEKANALFSGDTLFAAGIGRTDFPGGDMAQLMESIKTKLFELPDETIVYPGHGPETAIKAEKKFNPFI